MIKMRDLFKKIRDTKGTFHAKMSTIKDRNGMDLREAEDIMFPSREPGVSGDFWGSQEGCQGPFRPSGRICSVVSNSLQPHGL